MDPSTPSRGRIVAGIGGIALLIVMFLPWFGLGGEAAEAVEQTQQIAEEFGIGGEVPDTDANAFQSFEVIDLVLVAAALVAIGLAVAAVSGAGRQSPATNAIAVGLGALAALLVLYRLIDPPDAFGSLPSVPGFEVEVSRKIGAFLGLIAAAAVTLGGSLAMHEEEAEETPRTRPTGAGTPPPPPPPPTTRP